MSQYRTPTAKELLVTHVKGDSAFLKFWGLSGGAVEIVKNFELYFQTSADELERSSGFIRSDQTPVNLKCAVRSKIKKQWCRAVVLSPTHKRSDMIIVQLMDYGSYEEVSVADVRPLDESLLRYPAQARECILADVLPAGGHNWSVEAIKLCEEELLFNTMSCIVISEFLSIPIVRIAKKGESEPFVQRLINAGLAYIKRENPVPSQQVTSMTYRMNTLNPSTSHLVKISVYENPYKFYVQLAAAEVELNNLMEEIRLHTSKPENLALVNSPQINTPCLAMMKQHYYRGLITSVNQGRCLVTFVDIGFTEVKDFQELKAIHPRFLRLHAQAICCTLIKDFKINPDEFWRIVSQYPLLECHILGHTGEAYVVQLKVNGQDIFMPSPLIQPNSSNTQTLAYMYKNLSMNKSYEVKIAYINDISEFYCQLVSSKDELDLVTSMLISAAALKPISLQECQPKVPVIAKFSEDNAWYRAQIIKVNHERDIEVFFVDFGNYDNVTLKDLKRVNRELLNIPVQAYKCCLANTELPADSSLKDEMFDLFEEYTLKPLHAKVQDISDGETGQNYSVFLKELTSNSTVNEKFQNKFFNIVTIPISDIESLYITSFTSMESFFGQLTKLSSAKLEEMQEEINEFYAEAVNSSFKPRPADKVCAQYALDEQYYRARVEACSETTCDVFFMDFGNRESIPLKNVHPMNVKFLKYPVFGVECAFQKYPPATTVNKVESFMLENTIQAKMLEEKDNKWFITLTEDFPGNIKILEILRQHEKTVPRSIHGTGFKGFQENSPKQESEHFSVSNKGYDNTKNDVHKVPRYNVPSTEINNENECSSQYKTIQENNSEFPKKFTYLTVPSKAYRNVYVSHVINPSEFYCQIEEESTKLQELMQEIENTYSQVKDNELKISHLKIGDPCCAIYQADGAWYRGSIKKVNSVQSDVYFIDYGNIDTVPISKIKALKSEFMKLPAQALKCKLYNATPEGGTWSNEAIQDFINLAAEKSFVSQFVEADNTNTYAVNLVSLNKLEEDVLNKQFVSLGHGQLQDKNKILIFNSHAASSNLNFKSPEIKVGSSEKVIVSYGITPQVVFCQLKSNENEFKKMMQNLQHYYNKLSPSDAIVDRPHVGMICVAQFYQDLVWYRGHITKIDKNLIYVLYVDYGNIEIVEKKKIRCIAQDFTILPIQAIKCRIRGIAPPGKTWPSNNNVSKYYEGDALCEFISKEEDYYFINLTVNYKNVVEELIKNNLAIADGLIDKEEITVVKENSESIPQRQIEQQIPKRNNCEPGQLLSVTVSFAESPFRFWCQSLDESDILEQLMANIQGHINQGPLPANPNDLVPGYYCLAKYSVDESWYRALIKSCLPKDEYEVFFIDYGNTEITSLSSISNLPKEFKETHHLCFQCQLIGATSNCPSDKIEAFQNIIDNFGEDMTAKIEKILNNVYVVCLLYEENDEEKNVSEILFGSDAVGLTVAETTKFLPPDVPLGLQEGYVTIINTPHDFFIQLAGCEDNLADQTTELSEKCESNVEGQNILLNPVIGCACAAKFAEDGNWYRAEIIELQEATADVLFVDYGNESNVPKGELQVIEEKFLSVPPYAVKCKLNGVIPSTDQWSESAINKFKELVTDSLLGITFICKDIPAVVNVSKDDKDIGQTLIDLELANVDTCAETIEAYADDHLAAPIEDQLHSLPLDQSYPKRKLSSTKLGVKISYVDSCSKFYVMPLELSTELDTVMKTLEILYTQSATESENSPESIILDTIEEPRALLPCVAQYSEDELWYRALITEVEGDNIYVTFVDYGNSEVSSISNLKPMTPELLKIPPIAMECSLYAIQAVEGKEQELTAKLEEYFVDEVELVMEVYKPDEPYKIRLYHNGSDIAELLCQEGLAKEVIPPPEISNDDVIDSTINLTDDLKESSKTEAPPKEVTISRRQIALNGNVSVNVKHTEITDEVIVLYALPVDLEDDLAHFQDRVQNLYCENNQNSMPSIKISDYCAAKYHLDDSWYRAQILNISDEKVKVQFIDYGNCETVEKTDIKELFSELYDEPQFSIKFSPAGVIVEKGDEVQEKLDACLYNEPIMLHLCQYRHSKHGFCFLNLICENIDLMETLVEEKLLSQVYTPNCYLEEKFEANVESVIGSVFYILPIKFNSKRDELQHRLVEHCTAIETRVEEINPFRSYAAKVDNKWNRVSIISATDTNALVMCVDFGINASVELSNLVMLSLELSHEPLLLQPCNIKDYEEMPLECRDSILKRIESNEIFHFDIEPDSTNSSILVVKLIIEDSNQTSVAEIMKSESDEVNAKSANSELNLEITCSTEDSYSEETDQNQEIRESFQQDAENFHQEVKDNSHQEAEEIELSYENFYQEVKEISRQEAEDIELSYKDDCLCEDELNLEISCSTEDSYSMKTDRNQEIRKNLQDAENFHQEVKENSHQEAEGTELSYENFYQEVKEISCQEAEGIELSYKDDRLCEDERFFLPKSEEDVITEENQGEPQCELSDVEAEIEVTYEKGEDNKEKYVSDAKEREKVFKEEDEAAEQYASDIKTHEKLSDEDNEGDKSLLSDKTSEENENLGEDENNFEVSSEKLEITGSNENSLQKDFKQILDSMGKDECQILQRDNAVILGFCDKQEDDVSCDESGTHPNDELLDNECDRLRELSDVESEIKMSNIDEGCDYEGAESNQQPIESTLEQKMNKYEGNLSDLSQEPESGCFEHKSNENIQFENDKESLKEEVEKVYAKDETDPVQKISQEGECSIPLHPSNENQNDENDWDERPECDIKSELSGRITTISIDSISPIKRIHNENISFLHVPEEPEEDILSESASLCDENKSASFNDSPSKEAETNAHEEEPESGSSSIAVQKLSELAAELVCSFDQQTEVSVHRLTNSDVMISHFAVSEGLILFPVTPKHLLPSLYQLKGTLQQAYSLEQPLVSDISVSNIYVVLHENEWCRGKVLDLKDDLITVILIDTGLCATVESFFVKKLKEEHKEIPPFALWCVLASAYCPPSNVPVLQVFLDAMLNTAFNTKQDISVKIVQDEEPYKVNLFIEGNELLNVLLSEKQVIQRLVPTTISSGEHLGKISYLNCLKSNSIQLCANFVSELDNLRNLTECMQQSYGAESFKIPAVESGVYAVQHKGMWKRGKAVSSDDGLSLVLIDSGEIIKLTDVHALLPEHCSYPPFSVSCEIESEKTLKESDIATILSTLKDDEFLIHIEIMLENELKAKIIDECFLDKLLQLLVNVPSEL